MKHILKEANNNHEHDIIEIDFAEFLTDKKMAQLEKSLKETKPSDFCY